MVDANAARMRKLRDLSSYPLGLTEYQALEAARLADAQRYENLFDEVIIPSARNLEVDIPVIEADESKAARNEDFLESVQKDSYILESLTYSARYHRVGRNCSKRLSFSRNRIKMAFSDTENAIFILPFLTLCEQNQR